jgi:hypothetical protein
MIPTATNVEDAPPSSWATTSGSAVVIDGDSEGELPASSRLPCGDVDDRVGDGVGETGSRVDVEAAGVDSGERLGDGDMEADATGVFTGS